MVICVLPNEIYNSLKEHKGKITVKIDSLAASAASVIAMAGDMVYMSPVSMFMCHNPSIMLYGEVSELQQGIDFLNEVKECIINAYQNKTGLSRAKISKMMDSETWLNAKAALELGLTVPLPRLPMLSAQTLQTVWQTMLQPLTQATTMLPTLFQQATIQGFSAEHSDAFLLIHLTSF